MTHSEQGNSDVTRQELAKIRKLVQMTESYDHFGANLAMAVRHGKASLVKRKLAPGQSL
jgi:hypothetical protein